jgi:hypothetical protein
LDNDWFLIDAQASPMFRHCMRGVAPCITRARGGSGGHYVSKLHRYLHVQEIAGLQGVPSKLVAAMMDATRGERGHPVGQALGDAMSLNVLMRILPRALYCVGLLQKKPEDLWALATEHPHHKKKLLKKLPDDLCKWFSEKSVAEGD